jgi:hypothetical protein
MPISTPATSPASGLNRRDIRRRPARLDGAGFFQETSPDQLSDKIGDRGLVKAGQFRYLNPGDLPRIADNPQYSYLVRFPYERRALMDDIPQVDYPARMWERL